MKTFAEFKSSINQEYMQKVVYNCVKEMIETQDEIDATAIAIATSSNVTLNLLEQYHEWLSEQLSQ